MLYTLGMFFVWGLALALIGGVVGWLLRSLAGRSQRRGNRSTADDAEVVRLRVRVAELEVAEAERDRLRMELADVRGSTAGTLGFSSPAPDPRPDDGPRRRALDLAAAGTTLGRDVDLDDLTIVEGIGPTVAELCAAEGITTWRQLADTDVATLERILADGGDPLASHDPSSWPRQAGLLADGRWEDFTDLTRRLDGS